MKPESTQSGDFSFPAHLRLKHRKSIEILFTSGKRLNSFPIKVFYFIHSPSLEPALPKLSLSVSKKNFKRAVDRNRIKRQMREVYRLNKMPLLVSCVQHRFMLDMMWVFVSDKMVTYAEMERAGKTAIKKLCAQIEYVSKEELHSPKS